MNRTLQSAGILVFLVWAAASPAPAYHLGSVAVVTGGNPIRGMEDGVLLRQPCPDPSGMADPQENPSFSAVAGQPLTLAVTISPCTEGTQLELFPRVQCIWTTTPEFSMEGFTAAPHHVATKWLGLKGEIQVMAPTTLGPYSVVVDCRVEDQTLQPLTRHLYVTYQQPTPLVTLLKPPAAAWYALATAWVAGLPDTSTESQVLQKLVRSLYTHGQNNWRYGCFPTPRPSGMVPIGSFCYCPWQLLTEIDNPCNFGNCYQFSDVFESLASTLGIGVFGYTILEGAYRAGLITPAGVPSLDPHFTGNGSCTKSDMCPNYVFGSHNIRFRDGLFYDPTFGEVYPDRDHNIALDRPQSPRSGCCCPSEQEDLCLCPHGRAGSYGHWTQWTLQSLKGTICADEPCAAQAKKTLGASIQEVVVSEESWSENRALFALEARTRVTVPGTYTLYGYLLDEQGTVIASRGSWKTPTLTLADVELVPGGVTSIPFTFSGEQITRSSFSGGNANLVLLLFNQQGAGERYEQNDLPLPAGTTFQELPAMVLKVDGADSAKAKGPVHIDVTLDLQPGAKTLVQARLTKAGTTLGYGGTVALNAEGGKTPVRVTIEPGSSGNPFPPPPYQVVVATYQEDLQALGARCATLGGGPDTTELCDPGWKTY